MHNETRLDCRRARGRARGSGRRYQSLTSIFSIMQEALVHMWIISDSRCIDYTSAAEAVDLTAPKRDPRLSATSVIKLRLSAIARR
jgi:hypothetical protein